MLPLAWSLFNIVLLLAFLYAWVKAVKLLWHLKPWLAVIFVLGSLGSGSRSASSLASAKAEEVQTIKPSTEPIPPQVFQVIRENFSQNITLSGFFQRDSTGLRLASGTTHLNGFVLGFKWVPGRVFLSDDDARKTIRYRTHGDMYWNLLGIDVYTQMGQNLEGNLEILPPATPWKYAE